MEEFELKLRISPSDSKFRNLIGIDVYNKLHADTLEVFNSACCGCGYQPLNKSRALASLKLHVIELNEEIPANPVCNILCKACHSTQHIDITLEKGWGKLVNSTFSQKSLIETCRISAAQSRLNEENTRMLQTTPIDFIEKMKAGKLPANTKAKIIFTDKFEWGDI